MPSVEIDERKSNPYSPPRGLVTKQQSDSIKIKNGMNAIIVCVIFCMISITATLISNYFLGDYSLDDTGEFERQVFHRMIIYIITGFVQFFSIVTLTIGLVVIARSESGSRKFYIFVVAGLCIVIYLLPFVTYMLGLPHDWLRFVRLLFYLRWILIVPIFRWVSVSVGINSPRGSYAMSMLLFLFILGKVIEIFSSSLEYHFFGTFVFFVLIYLGFLGAVIVRSWKIRRRAVVASMGSEQDISELVK